MLAALVARRETIRVLTRAQLAAGHRDKLLGHLWNLLDPLASLAVYYLVFGIGFRQAAGSPREFVLYLFLGLVVWRFFSESITQAATCLRAQRGLILAADFPKAVIPTSICLARLYDLLWALAVVAGVALALGAMPSLRWALLPLALALAFALTLGLAFVVARVGLDYADTVNVLAAGLRLGVFLSPVFYYARAEAGRHEGIVPPGLLDYYTLNPIVGLLELFRAALIGEATPRPADALWVAGVATSALVLGFAFFARGEGRYAKSV